MPVYQYKAATIDGEIFNGTLSGSSREQVVAQLQALGQIPIQVDETVQAGVSQRRSPRRGLADAANGAQVYRQHQLATRRFSCELSPRTEDRPAAFCRLAGDDGTGRREPA